MTVNLLRPPPSSSHTHQLGGTNWFQFIHILRPSKRESNDVKQRLVRPPLPGSPTVVPSGVKVCDRVTRLGSLGGPLF